MNGELIIGSHVSITDGLLGAAMEAAEYGANTFMVYTGAPQNSVRKPLEKMKIAEGKKFMDENGFVYGFVVHAPYIINLASFKDDIFGMSVANLKNEIKRTKAFGSRYLVLHPGSFTEKDLDYGISRIIDGLDRVLGEDSEDGNGGVVVCLETMAGKGSEVGRSFEEIRRIIDGVSKENRKRVAVCFDTCHVHDAGYDIIDGLDSVMTEFDRIIGLDFIKVFHINGSLNKRGAKKDRHANIGADTSNPKGVDNIGFEALSRLVHSDYAKGRFLILETPWLNDNENLYRQEISMLRGTGK